ncbi:MAG: metal ABC transporter substrate-binding protein [Candidatus Bipolaricaulota bacterium]|nr:metal ABC transporter substrate-binding protein [Candidatus Bipolaricaulota bacterium]
MRTTGLVSLASALLAAFSVQVVSQITVLCTTTIVGDVVRRVAGEDARVSVLLPVGADPHAFQASPQDAMAIEMADVVFLSGAGLETSLLPLLESATGSVVDLSGGLTLREHDGDDDHEGSGMDPHVWLDPLNVVEWTREIADTLGEVDPGRADVFSDRAAAYTGELYALDSWIRDRVATLPPEARNLVTDHEAFGYFADRYGFEQIGAVIPSYSTLSEPSARELAALEDAIRAARVLCLFVGTTIPAALAEQVAADTGIRIVFLYAESLSEADGPAATYLDLMRFDVDQIVAGLTGSP